MGSWNCELIIGRNDLNGLFQHKQFYNSVILIMFPPSPSPPPTHPTPTSRPHFQGEFVSLYHQRQLSQPHLTGQQQHH